MSFVPGLAGSQDRKQVSMLVSPNGYMGDVLKQTKSVDAFLVIDGDEVSGKTSKYDDAVMDTTIEGVR